MLLIDVETPANSSLDYTNEVMHSMTDFIEAQSYVEKIALNVGNSNPRIYYNEIPKRGVASYGQVLLVLKAYDEKEVNSLVKTLRAEFSQWHQAKITVKEFTQGPVTDQPVTVRLISESLSDLERVAADLEAKMASLPGAINLDNPIGIANTELALDIDYDKAALSGININQLDNTIQTALSGTFIGQFNDSNGENYPILVRRPKSSLDGLADITIVNNQGDSIPLGQFVETKLQKGRTDFFHYQKLRMARVSADAGQGYSVQQITSEVVDYLDNYQLPAGMYYLLGGEEESRQESFAGLSQIMLITAIGIFAILVLQFKSFLQPLIIFTSIPFAMTGAVLGLYLTNLSFSMMAFIGLISLFGIVVNNAIILIDTTNRNLLTCKDKKQAILSASSTRFTPILLTTITTIGGLLPLTLFGGSLWQPLGVVIISGLCVSAVASFIIVPLLTELFTQKEPTKNIKA
jgi:multidrug efflux pump subunit AcrB